MRNQGCRANEAVVVTNKIARSREIPVIARLRHQAALEGPRHRISSSNDYGEVVLGPPARHLGREGHSSRRDAGAVEEGIRRLIGEGIPGIMRAGLRREACMTPRRAEAGAISRSWRRIHRGPRTRMSFPEAADRIVPAGSLVGRGGEWEACRPGHG